MPDLSWLTLAVLAAATILASVTDWVFSDLLIHRYYARTPGIWRPGSGPGRIILSQAIGTFASAATILLCLITPGHVVMAAALIWCAGPLPVIVQNLQWIGMHPAVAASHGAGWAARLGIAAALTQWVLAR